MNNILEQKNNETIGKKWIEKEDKFEPILKKIGPNILKQKNNETIGKRWLEKEGKFEPILKKIGPNTSSYSNVS